MPTYILLSSLTAQGVQTLKSNPDRLREVNRDVEELGAKVLHQWATLGPFDFVNVVEAPDDATIARVSVALGARGSAKLQTLSAVTIPWDESGSNAAAASPVAIQPGPEIRSSQVVAASVTCGRRGHVRGRRSASVRNASMLPPCGSGLVYHQPSGTAATDVAEPAS